MLLKRTQYSYLLWGLRSEWEGFSQKQNFIIMIVPTQRFWLISKKSPFAIYFLIFQFSRSLSICRGSQPLASYTMQNETTYRNTFIVWNECKDPFRNKKKVFLIKYDILLLLILVINTYCVLDVFLKLNKVITFINIMYELSFKCNTFLMDKYKVKVFKYIHRVIKSIFVLSKIKFIHITY